MKIDWNEAPEWAKGHGLVASLGQIRQVWYGDQAYMILGDSRSYCYGGGDGDTRHNHMPNQIQFKTPRPAAWTGEGLPPVGTECLMSDGKVAGVRVKILAHDGCLAVFGREGEYRGLTAKAFRKIKTVSELMAEEREAAINQMREDAGSMNSFPFEQLYEAGWRKQADHE